LASSLKKTARCPVSDAGLLVQTVAQKQFDTVDCQTLTFLAKSLQFWLCRTRDSNETCRGDGNFKMLTIRDLFRLLLATVML